MLTRAATGDQPPRLLAPAEHQKIRRPTKTGDLNAVDADASALKRTPIRYTSGGCGLLTPARVFPARSVLLCTKRLPVRKVCIGRGCSGCVLPPERCCSCAALNGPLLRACGPPPGSSPAPRPLCGARRAALRAAAAALLTGPQAGRSPPTGFPAPATRQSQPRFALALALLLRGATCHCQSEQDAHCRSCI